MRHPGRLLAVVRQVLELGPGQAGATLARLSAAMSDGDVQQCLEYCRWVASAPSRTVWIITTSSTAPSPLHQHPALLLFPARVCPRA
jgi:hypothetical protein